MVENSDLRSKALQSCLLSFYKQNKIFWFRKLSVTIYKKQENLELINVKKNENDRIKWEINKQEKQQNIYLEELNSKTKQLKSELEKHKKQYDNSWRIIEKRVSENVIINCRLAVLHAWKDYAKEKKRHFDKAV